MPKSYAVNAVSMRKEEERWRAESDMRALQEAEAIKRDPKRLKAAQDCAKEKLLGLAKIASDDDAD